MRRGRNQSAASTDPKPFFNPFHVLQSHRGGDAVLLILGCFQTGRTRVCRMLEVPQFLAPIQAWKRMYLC